MIGVKGLSVYLRFARVVYRQRVTLRDYRVFRWLQDHFGVPRDSKGAAHRRVARGAIACIHEAPSGLMGTVRGERGSPRRFL